jgi:mono/diheme cytochrome c family protein
VAAIRSWLTAACEIWRSNDMPKLPQWILYAAAVLVVLSWLPLLLIARARATKSPDPRIHLVQDMGIQPKFGPQSPNPAFADQRAMRPPAPGTVARGQLQNDDHYYRGKVNGDWAVEFPVEVTSALVSRGRQRFDIYCATCHGVDGAGNGPTNQRAVQRQAPTWIPPASLHTETVRERQVGHLFNTITHGIRNMPAYESQIPVEDRWAIVAYVRALQLSRNARLEDVPPDKRDALR